METIELVEDFKKDLSVMDERLAKYDLPVNEWGAMFLQAEELREKLWGADTLPRLEKTLTPEVMRKASYEVLNERLNRVRGWKQVFYDRYEADRKNNISFSERRKRLDSKKERIDWCDKEEAKLLSFLNSLKPKPVRHWLELKDYWLLKGWGLRRYLAHLAPEDYLIA